MSTECNRSRFEFHVVSGRQVVAQFDGGTISSDAGGLLLRQVEERTGIIARLAGCFRDCRDPDKTEHTVEQLVGQRIYGLALGYEDLNDHDQLRQDPLLAALIGKHDPEGGDRRRERDRGKAGAGRSTLNRLELTPADANAQHRYKKIVLEEAAVDLAIVELFLDAHAEAPEEMVLDLDATDDPIHGQQEGRFFHGFYNEYCYLPLYIFCGEFLLCARLRPSNLDASAGALEEVQRIVARVRSAWPKVRMILRADSGFCRDQIMSWCEASGVDYVFGLAKNQRLVRAIGAELQQAQREFEQTGKPARVFRELQYQTRKTWSRKRRVVAKAEHLAKGANPRFVVTSLRPGRMATRELYEDFYCARGEMENRIKEQQLCLFADRTSTAYLRSNQIRLYFSSFAYLLLQALRRLGLKGTEMARAQCGTMRLKLLKIGAQIRITVRKIWVSMASACPFAQLFAEVYRNLQRVEPLRC
jgi:hypothetical protein